MLLNIFGTKQKLSIQIGNLNLVIIRDGDETLTLAVMTSYTHHGEIFQEFTSQRTTSDHEGSNVTQFFLKGLSERSDLMIVS